jgi:hypothetical protein
MRKSLRAVLVLLIMTAAWIHPSIPAAARTRCGPSAGVRLCLTVPDGVLSKANLVRATLGGGGGGRVEFTWRGAYLNYEYLAPYEFLWPTGKYVDAKGTLSARVRRGGTLGAPVSFQVRLQNGNRRVPKNPSDWRSIFRPRPRSGDEVVAAVGNAGADKPDEVRLRSMIKARRPSIFLYLGEVHEFGSWATRRDHYGLASFDDPKGRGTKWGSMAHFTQPTQGNHESGKVYTRIYRDYWHQRPHWSSFRYAGVRFYNLNSECSTIGGCGTGSAQYKWLRRRVALDTERCVVSFWQKPVVSEDSKRSGPKMIPTWSLLARSGGDLVINGHTREMEQSVPLNANLQPRRAGSHMVELISGAGAARWVRNLDPDPRIVWSRFRVPGALFVGLDLDAPSGDRLRWTFRDVSGAALRSGSVSC